MKILHFYPSYKLPYSSLSISSYPIPIPVTGVPQLGQCPPGPTWFSKTEKSERRIKRGPQMWQYEHRFSHSSPRSDEQQGPIYTVQYAGRHTPIKHLGQAAPAVTGNSNEVRTFAVGSVYDLFHDRAIGNVRPGLDTFFAELSL
jgi:hypothetical protein